MVEVQGFIPVMPVTIEKERLVRPFPLQCFSRGKCPIYHKQDRSTDKFVLIGRQRVSESNLERVVVPFYYVIRKSIILELGYIAVSEKFFKMYKLLLLVIRIFRLISILAVLYGLLGFFGWENEAINNIEGYKAILFSCFWLGLFGLFLILIVNPLVLKYPSKKVANISKEWSAIKGIKGYSILKKII